MKTINGKEMITMYVRGKNKIFAEVADKNHSHVEYKLKGDFALIKGEITLADGKASVNDVHLPNGFIGGVDPNFVVVGVTFRRQENAYATTGHYSTALGYTTGALDYIIMLKDNRLDLRFISPPLIGTVVNSTGVNITYQPTNRTYTYTIVIMKV